MGRELTHLPGMLFVAPGILPFGRLVGWAVTLAGGVLSVCMSFLLVRAARGQGHQGPRPLRGKAVRPSRRALRPDLVLLRLVLCLAPPVNQALALSNIRLSDHLASSVLGLLGPTTGAAVLFDWSFR